jgi:hypothetical protein
MCFMARAHKNADRHRQRTVSFRLPDEVMDELRILAKRNRRTLSGEAQLAFEKHLAASGVDGTGSQKNDTERR